MKPLRTCALCKEEYEFCSSCPEKITVPVWKNSFCSENCKKIYDICARYHMGELTKEEAQSLLEQCDLSKRAKYSNATKKILKEIQAKSRRQKSKPAADPETSQEISQ